MTRTPLAIVAWTHVPRRQQDLSRVLEAVLIVPAASSHRLPALVRYLYGTTVTAWSLLRLRPKAVIVTAPPVPAAVLVYLLSRVLRYRFLLDSHPGAFGLMGDRFSARLRPVHDFLLSRASYVGVTTESLASQVRLKGGRPGLLHEPPPVRRRYPPSDYVLFAGSGGRDEPYQLVFDAARLIPDVRFVATGAPDPSLGIPPSNVQVTGWVEPAVFEELLGSSLAVLVLSDEKESVMRTAYEAAYAEKPLVVSRTPATERFFPHAVLVSNDAAGIAAGLKHGLTTSPSTLTRQREFSLATWQTQLATIQEGILGVGTSPLVQQDEC